MISEGLVDPEKIGIIGFSRTCFYVMETLTNSSFHLRAASITDGVMEDYLQYMITVDFAGNSIAHDYDSMIGVPPFGEGLQQWLKQSPGFKLDKISAPLLVVEEKAPFVRSLCGSLMLDFVTCANSGFDPVEYRRACFDKSSRTLGIAGRIG